MKHIVNSNVINFVSLSKVRGISVSSIIIIVGLNIAEHERFLKLNTNKLLIIISISIYSCLIEFIQNNNLRINNWY